MKWSFCIGIALTLPFSAHSIFAQAPTADQQIAAAVKAAPVNLRAEASVLGFDADGNLVTLRTGPNELICLADDPNREGYAISCYHKDLEPFMARGRELKAAGKEFKEIFDTREAEAVAGTLAMPTSPATLYVLSGKEAFYNAEADSVEGAKIRFVIYVPFATAETTGLPLAPTGPGEPWLMDAGTHRAHIMVTPK